VRGPLLATLLLAAGCGRLGFTEERTADADSADSALSDGFTCSPVGHDEDGDGVEDACDVCPHLAGPQVDQDGDRVGDACDPEPTLPRQRIVLFDPFASLDPAWIVNEASVQNDELRLDGLSGLPVLKRDYQRGDDLFVVGGGIANARPMTARIFGLIVVDGVGGRYYCEFFDNTVMSQFQFTYSTDGTNYTSEGARLPMVPVTGGAGMFSMALAGARSTCTTTWRGEDLVAQGTIPNVVASEVWIYSENFDTTLQYFLQIRTEQP
jgi:hypothetical protein